MAEKTFYSGYRYPFTTAPDSLKRQVWLKARPFGNWNADEWRVDACGSLMFYGSHGLESENGWEIDHIYPKSKGGSDDVGNLQPLQWLNNRRKGDQFPWSC